jgi:hypothetical protein
LDLTVLFAQPISVFVILSLETENILIECHDLLLLGLDLSLCICTLAQMLMCLSNKLLEEEIIEKKEIESGEVRQWGEQPV